MINLDFTSRMIWNNFREEMIQFEKSIDQSFCKINVKNVPSKTNPLLQIEIEKDDSTKDAPLTIRGYFDWEKSSFYDFAIIKNTSTDDVDVNKSLKPFLFPLQLVEGPGLIIKNGAPQFFSYNRTNLLSSNIVNNPMSAYLSDLGVRRLHYLYSLIGKRRKIKSVFFTPEDRKFIKSFLSTHINDPKVKDLIEFLSHPNNIYGKSFYSFDRLIREFILSYINLSYRDTYKTRDYTSLLLPYWKLKRINSFRYYSLEEKNPFITYNARNKIILFGGRIKAKLYYHRMFHPSHFGFIAPYQTPESEKIGLILERASGTIYRKDQLFNTFTVETEDNTLCIDDIVEKGYFFSTQGIEVEDIENSFFCHKKEKQISLKNPAGAFSALTLLIPFANHNDSARLLMAVKNIKQALPLVYGEAPKTKTEYYDYFRKTQNELYNAHEYGVNLLTAYIPFKGYNFEDGIVISESAAEKLTSFHKNIVEFGVTDGDELHISENSREFKLLFKDSLQANCQYDLLKKQYPDLIIRKRETQISIKIQKRSAATLKTLVKLPENIEIPINFNEYTFFTPDENVFYYGISIEERRKAVVGDKLIGRHANKGVITKIIPESEMPQFSEGKAELLINPMSVVSRMNIGQLMETSYNNNNKIPFFYYFNELHFDGMSKGAYETGPSFQATAGLQYFHKLDHCAKDKVYYAKTPRFDFFGHPIRGKKNFGGMRLGEMEFWGLQSHGVYSLIHTILTTMVYEKEYDELSRPLQFFGWYLMLLKVQLNIKEEKQEFIPFYKANSKTVEKISQFSFTKIDSLDDVFHYYIVNNDKYSHLKTKSPQDKIEEIARINSLNALSAQFWNNEIPRYIELTRLPKTILTDDILPNKLFNKDVLLVLPAKFLLTSDILNDLLTNSVYKTLKKSTVEKTSIKELPKVKFNYSLFKNDRQIKDRKKRGERKKVPYSNMNVDGDAGFDAVIGALTGKDGLIRKYLLAGRVKSSGRAVIVPEPKLMIDEITLPSIYGKEWENDTDVLGIRYPSLFRYNIMKYRINKSFASPYVIKLNPLICSMIAGDFDGDAMTFLLNQEMFDLEPIDFSPSDNLYKDATGEVFLHFVQDLKYGYYLLKKDKNNRNVFRGTSISNDILTIFANNNSIDNFMKELYFHLKDKNHFIHVAEEFSRMLFRYITENPFSISLHQLIENVDVDSSNNHFLAIVKSGARGNQGQLEKMKSKVKGNIFVNLETNQPKQDTKSSFTINTSLLEGLTPFELAFFSNDGRSGLGEKKLKTPDGGDFNRRLHEILYDIEITKEDNGKEGLVIINKEIIYAIQNSLSLYFPGTDLKNDNSLERFLSLRICKSTKKEPIEYKNAAALLLNDKEILISSPKSIQFNENQVVSSAFGFRDIFLSEKYSAGQRIGLIAAESIGEQATQLAMKSFQGITIISLDTVIDVINNYVNSDMDFFASSFLISKIYDFKVRPVFIELLLHFLKEMYVTHDITSHFTIKDFHKLPWKDGFYNCCFGYLKDNFKQLKQEAKGGISYKVEDSYKFRLLFDNFTVD